MSRPRGLGCRPYWQKTSDRVMVPRAQWHADRIDLSQHCEIIDQEYTSACVGCAVSQSLLVTSSFLHRPTKVSPRAIYAQALRKAAGPGASVYPDIGCYPRDAYDSIRALGVVLESDWPLDLVHITDQPPFSKYQKAHKSKHVSYQFALAGKGSAIRTALSLGVAPTIAMLVDDDFMTLGSGHSPWSRSGFALGSHYVACVGYTQDHLLVANSYGTAWGDGGFARISWGQIDSDETHSVIIPGWTL